ncbi:MAG: hypothetical protein AAFP69_10380 [Planctomycetota bacterium]
MADDPLDDPKLLWNQFPRSEWTRRLWYFPVIVGCCSILGLLIAFAYPIVMAASMDDGGESTIDSPQEDLLAVMRRSLADSDNTRLTVDVPLSNRLLPMFLRELAPHQEQIETLQVDRSMPVEAIDASGG